MTGAPVVLLLAGTAEARAIASLLTARGQCRVIASLSGATGRPAPMPCEVRRGGFGGVAGLIETLKTNQVRAVIDATHPFANQISANAEAACRALALPRLHLRRPGWSPGAGDNWRRVPDLAAASRALPENTRAFLTTGRNTLPAFRLREDVWFLARVIARPPGPSPLRRGAFVIGTPPFTEAHERALMREHRIGVLVSKDSGGKFKAKLAAARALSLPVVMIDRPPPPPGEVAETPEAAIAWLDARI